MRYRIVGPAIAAGLFQFAACASAGPSHARLCLDREGQNGSLDNTPTIVSIRSRATGRVVARRRFETAGSLCARVRRGRYTLAVRLAEPWTGIDPPRWWTRTFPLDLRRGDARYVMTNPPTNDVFQAMIAGPDGWHRLWPVHRVRR